MDGSQHPSWVHTTACHVWTPRRNTGRLHIMTVVEWGFTCNCSFKGLVSIEHETCHCPSLGKFELYRIAGVMKSCAVFFLQVQFNYCHVCTSRNLNLAKKMNTLTSALICGGALMFKYRHVRLYVRHYGIWIKRLFVLFFYFQKFSPDFSETIHY